MDQAAILKLIKSGEADKLVKEINRYTPKKLMSFAHGSHSLLDLAVLAKNGFALERLLTAAPWPEETRRRAAFLALRSSQNIDLIASFISETYTVQDTLEEASKVGNLTVVQYLVVAKQDAIDATNPKPMLNAAANGQLAVLQILKQHQLVFQEHKDEALCLAVRFKHQTCVQFLLNLKNKAPELHPSPEPSLALLKPKPSSMDKSILGSIRRLKLRYEKVLNPAFEVFTLQAIARFEKQLGNQLAAKAALHDILLDTTSYTIEGTSLKELLILCWLAIHDMRLRKGPLSEALRMLTEGLAEMQSEDSIPELCESRKFHKLIEKLVGVHPDAEIRVVTHELASLKLSVLVQDEAVQYRKALPYNLFSQRQSELETIWPFIREKVKQKLFEDFADLFDSYDDPELTKFVDAGCSLDETSTLTLNL